MKNIDTVSMCIPSNDRILVNIYIMYETPTVIQLYIWNYILLELFPTAAAGSGRICLSLFTMFYYFHSELTNGLWIPHAPILLLMLANTWDTCVNPLDPFRVYYVSCLFFEYFCESWSCHMFLLHQLTLCALLLLSIVHSRHYKIMYWMCRMTNEASHS